MRRAGMLAAFFLSSAAAMAAPALHLEGEPFLPYRMNRVVISSEEGITGPVALTGLRWDGSRVPLAETRVKVLNQSVELVFYLDEDIRTLELRRSGQEALTLDLVAGQGQGRDFSPEETAVRNRMRNLDPPVHFTPDGESPARFSFLGSDLVMAGFQASTALFALPVSYLPLWILGAFVGCVLILIPMKAGPWKTGSRIILAGGATAVVLFWSHGKPVLFSVAFPNDGPGVRVSGMLERRVEEMPGYTKVIYAPGDVLETSTFRPGAELIGLWSPSGRGLPLAEVFPSGSLVRFSAPPLVTEADGDYFLSSNHFLTGWVVHETR